MDPNTMYHYKRAIIGANAALRWRTDNGSTLNIWLGIFVIFGDPD